MAFSVGQPFHSGEEHMHELLHVPERDNPTSFMLTPQAAFSLQSSPIIAIGTLDSEKRPWTTLWGGQPPLSQPLGNSIIGIKTLVDRKHDPVVEALFGKDPDGELVREQGTGRMISGLTCHLEPRKRVKLFGRMVAGAAGPTTNDEDLDVGQAQVQLVMKIEQSLGNCPKYLNCKAIRPVSEPANILTETTYLTDKGVELIHGSDMFFLSSSNSEYDMDTNHRGGPRGFVRVQTNNLGESEIVWPEYSGNRLYQTLGNLTVTPLAGLVFPDFVSGDVLYVTGRTDIYTGKEASAILPRSNLVVKLTVSEAKYVEKGLPFRGTPGEMSPYNPEVRLLASEQALSVPDTSTKNTATLVSLKSITPTIYRLRFKMNSRETWKPGQWVALDFSGELDIGYSHMRDDDPLSLNDDYVRTFTVSSSPGSKDARASDEFEITIRSVGRVTNWLTRQNPNAHIEIAVRGFAGDFNIVQTSGDEKTAFVAGGVGITPLLAQISEMDAEKLVLFWSLQLDDVGLAIDLFESHPQIAQSFRLFITGGKSPNDAQSESLKQLRDAGARCELRRLQKADLNVDNLSSKWYLCCSTPLRKILAGWLEGKELIFEDFAF